MQTLIDKRLAEILEEKNYAEGKLLKKDNIIGKVFDGVIQGQKLLVGVSEQSGVFIEFNLTCRMMLISLCRNLMPLVTKKSTRGLLRN